MFRRCALLLLALPQLLFAMNGLADIGAGIKACGMGGVGVAYPQDSFASIANPAALSHIGSRWDVGVSALFNDGWSQLAATALEPLTLPSSKNLYWPEVAISWEFCRGQAVGLAVAPYGGLNTVNATAFINSEFFLYPLQVVPSWSWRINCAHSIGVSIPIALIWFRHRGLNIGISLSSVYPDDVTNRGSELEAGAAIQVGWLGHITHSLAVGATVRSRTWMARFVKYQGLLPNNGEVDLPPMGGVGVTWHFCPRWIASAEIVHYLWQKVDWLGNNSRQAGAFWGQFGTAEGTGFGWSDQTVVKVGVVWDLLPCLALRAGYNYGREPIAPTETSLNQLTLATVEHHLTAGLSWELCCYEISLFYAYGFSKRVDGHDSVGLLSPALEVNIRNRQQAAGVAVGRLF